jgi:signal peptidase I
MKRWLFLLSLGALGAFILRTALLEGIYIATASMEPTLPVGTHVFVNKAVFKVRSPRRGEIVVFPSPVEKKDLVKRVIAVAGDEVKLEKKKVILNGVALDEPYVRYTRPDEMLVGDNLDVGRVPPGSVFLLGDNRDQSGDSRDWKDPQTGEHIFFLRIDELKGKLLGVE